MIKDDVLVRVEGVSKKYCRRFRRSLWYGVKDTAADLTGSCNGVCELRQDEFWAVDDVSFEIKRGECLGLIGRNGAGKTTLLKMLNGLIKPDKGRIEIRGRVGGLIALGAGFNPILTGRENIYVNGAVLGLSKREIGAKMDEIIDFAEIAEFIDTPVQSYSSGMTVRLGFAVAAHINANVLLVDEVLAVGDAGFRIKCYNKLFEIRDRTATIVVSHSMPQIGKVCTNGFVMCSGRTVCEKTSLAEAIQWYLDQFDAPDLSTIGNGAIEIKRITFQQSRDGSHTLYPSGCGRAHVYDLEPTAETILELHCIRKRATSKIVVLWSIGDMEQKPVAQTISDVLDPGPAARCLRIRTKLSALNLSSGRYTLSVYMFESDHGAWDTILAGLHNFAGFSARVDICAGAAPISYSNQTEIDDAGGGVASIGTLEGSLPRGER